MRISITQKVFLTLLAATSVVVVGMYLFMQYSFEQGLVNFLEARQQQRIDTALQRLSEEYSDSSGWGRLRENRAFWSQLIRGRPLDPHPPKRHTDPDDRHPPHLKKPQLALLDTDKSVITGWRGDINELELHPIVVDSETVGYLGLKPGPPPKELVERRFEERHTQSLVFIALGMLILSAALGVPLAYTMVRPLRRITESSRELAKGNYQVRLPVTSGDEIGQLACDMNDLAKKLQKTEQSRRHWVADISHELRTPLTVLRGEVEAIQDEVRPFTKESIASLHGEIMQLSRLVDELYHLSLSDIGALTYHKAKVDLLALLEDSIAALDIELQQKGIELKFTNNLDRIAFVYADADWLATLFRNLLANSLKYTSAQGVIEIGLGRTGDLLVVDFQDTEPGVPDQALELLFDRFYRVDRSRSRATGGAGLGLAICSNIVEAHDGHIEARHSPLGGLWIQISLPAAS